jgi:RimJ/RimL family protein N-acetyltransferase
MKTMTNNCHPEYPPVPQDVTTERLIIRPSVRADAPYLKKWWNDPAIAGTGGFLSGMQYDDDDMENWFQRYVDGRSCATHFVICLQEPGERPIGEFYIASDDRPGCVGLALLIGETDLWGHGYATEALRSYAEALFDSGLCEAIRVDTRRDNAPAIRVCEHVGFDVEVVWANGLFQTMILTRDAFEYQRSHQSQTHAV